MNLILILKLSSKLDLLNIFLAVVKNALQNPFGSFKRIYDESRNFYT